jgi:hypothetical protein
LKRLNNLQNDQDFYALANCRVPVRRFGLLDETIPSSTLIDLDQPSNAAISVTHLSQQNHRTFLDAMDQDLASMRLKMERVMNNQSATDTLVSSQSILARQSVKPVSHRNHDWSCDDTDCRCKIWQTVTIIILIVLIPFIYVYFYLKSRHSNKL